MYVCMYVCTLPCGPQWHGSSMLPRCTRYEGRTHYGAQDYIEKKKKKMFLMAWESVYIQCTCTSKWFSEHTVVGVVYCRQEKNNIYPCTIRHVAMLLMDQRPVNNNNDDFNPIHLMVYSYKAYMHNCWSFCTLIVFMLIFQWLFNSALAIMHA